MTGIIARVYLRRPRDNHPHILLPIGRSRSLRPLPCSPEKLMDNVVVLPRTRCGLAVTLLVLAGALPACDSGPQTAATVQLAAPTTSILVGQTVQVSATVKDKSGKTLLNRPILYQTSAPTIVSVSGEGLVLGVTPGSGAVIATVDGVTDRLTFVVSPVPVARVAMSRDTATVRAATTLQLTATPQDSAGHTLADRTLTWSSSDPAVATVTGTGLVSALTPGTATITASTEGKSGTTRLTVTPAAIASIDVTPSTSILSEGSTKQLTATAKDAAGRVLSGRTFTWTSSDVTKATVSNTGLVTAVAPGVANIVVTAENIAGGAAVQVVAVVIGSVSIAPDSATVLVGGTVQFSATVKDTAGKDVSSFKPASWSSLDTTVAKVDGTGKVSGIAAGRTAIVAQRDGLADTAIVKVNPTPVGSIVLSPTPVHVGVGRSGRMAVTLYDATGNILTGRRITYEMGPGGFATVDTTGLITGVAAGITNLLITSGSAVATTQVIVETTVVAEVVVQPAFVVFTSASGSQTLSVVTKDSGDNILPGRTLSFSSSNANVATVSPTGIVTAVASGQAIVTVTSEGVSKQVDVTVQ